MRSNTGKGEKANKSKVGSKGGGQPQRTARGGVENHVVYRDYSGLTPEAASLLFQASGNVPAGAALSPGQLPQGKLSDTGKQQYGFAVKLHYMLGEIESSEEGSIVSWQPHGRCFLVRDREKFVETVLPNWFQQNSFPSFQRQLNLYGFRRISSGVDKGGYYHELFLRMKPDLARYIQRTKTKGTGPRKPDNPNSEPDFYSLPFLPQHRHDLGSAQDRHGLPQQAQVSPVASFPNMFGLDPGEQLQQQLHQSQFYSFHPAAQHPMQAVLAAQRGMGNFPMAGAVHYGGVGSASSPLLQPVLSGNAGMGHLTGLPRRWTPPAGNFGDNFNCGDPNFPPLPASINAAWNATSGLGLDGQLQGGGGLHYSHMTVMENASLQQQKYLQQLGRGREGN